MLGSAHLPNNAILHVGFLIAALFTHQGDLQLAERLGQNVALCEEFPPLHNVSLEERCVILMTEYSLNSIETNKILLVIVLLGNI